MTEEADSKSWLEQLSQLLLREPQDREQLVKLLRDAQDRHLLDTDSLSMIEGVLQVSDMKVRDVMIPRAKMTVINKDATIKECVQEVTESGHSRFPVIGENRDEILGILLAKDLLPYAYDHSKKFNLSHVYRATIFIPESKRLNVLLKEFRLKHNHMAIVVDEYGGVSGLVTIEDVLEQIVGEIEDESDIDESEYHIKEISKNQFTVKGLTPIEEFNQHFGTDFSDAEFDTIGGYVTQHFGHLPKRNETIELAHCKFKVLHADNRRLRLLRVTVV